MLGISSAASAVTETPVGTFPTPADVGVPAGWVPAHTYSSTQTITTPGITYSDVLITDGDLEVHAANVTVERCKLLNGMLRNDGFGTTLYQPVTYRQCTVTGPGDSAIIAGGFHAIDCFIDGGGEGFGISGSPATSIIEHCYVHCVPPPGAGGEWHGDCCQGYLGGDLEIYNSVFWLASEAPPREGTSPLFWADGSGHLTVNGLICRGGGESFRSYYPMNVTRLYVVEDEWIYGPVDNDCDMVEVWTNNWLCTLDGDGQPVPTTVLNCGIG